MTRVIFACVHNAGRSQMAAAFFNQLSDPKTARASSAGTEPGPRVHPEVLAAMKEIGLDLSEATPQLLTAELAAGSRYLVTMGCGEKCPFVPGVKVLDWPLDDPKGQSMERVREIRDDVRRRVQEFIDANAWGSEGS
jgi:arsenate reductase (thioredoxin)